VVSCAVPNWTARRAGLAVGAALAGPLSGRVASHVRPYTGMTMAAERPSVASSQRHAVVTAVRLLMLLMMFPVQRDAVFYRPHRRPMFLSVLCCSPVYIPVKERESSIDIYSDVTTSEAPGYQGRIYREPNRSPNSINIDNTQSRRGVP